MQYWFYGGLKTSGLNLISSVQLLLLYCLAQVNVGKMDSPIEKWNLIIGNLALKQVRLPLLLIQLEPTFPVSNSRLLPTQVQATVVGFLAAVAAVVLGWIPEGKFQMSHAVLLCSSSVATAFIASLLQGKHTVVGHWGPATRTKHTQQVQVSERRWKTKRDQRWIPGARRQSRGGVSSRGHPGLWMFK